MDLWALFVRDIPSGQYQARLGFTLAGISTETAGPRGIPVTDLRWRALGRQWLGESGTELSLTGAQLRERLGTEAVRFPSDHGGFLGGEYGQRGDPDAFAAKLREVLSAS